VGFAIETLKFLLKMRFRTWLQEPDEMVGGYVTSDIRPFMFFEGRVTIPGVPHFIPMEAIQVGLGIKDSSGREVFEGDIVVMDVPGGAKLFCEIAKDKDSSSLAQIRAKCFKKINTEMKEEIYDPALIMPVSCLRSGCKVIGDTRNNPDLLNESLK
jgi:hypothetical protein